MYRFWHFCLWPVYACSQFMLGSGCVYSTGIWFRLLYFHGLSGGTQGWGNVFTSVSPFFPLLISKGVCPDTFAKQLLYRRPGSGLSPLSNWICICKSIQLNIRWTSSQSHVNIPSFFLFFLCGADFKRKHDLSSPIRESQWSSRRGMKKEGPMPDCGASSLSPVLPSFRFHLTPPQPLSDLSGCFCCLSASFQKGFEQSKPKAMSKLYSVTTP